MIRSPRSALLVLASSLVLPAIAHAQEIKWREWNAGMREAAASVRLRAIAQTARQIKSSAPSTSVTASASGWAMP